MTAHQHADHDHDLEDLAVQAQYHLGWGDPFTAVHQCETLATRFAELDGRTSARAFVWRSHLGRALIAAHRHADAEAVLSGLVAERARVEGADAPGTLVARGNLARAVAFGGRPREGILLAERLLADRERLHGPRHPTTLATHGHLALFHLLVGDHRAAMRVLSGLVVDRRSELGPDHELTRQTQTNLALAAARADPSRVELDAVITEVLADGPEPDLLDPFVRALRAMAVEGMLARRMFDEALELVDALLDATDAFHGPASPHLLEVVRTRARVLTAAQRRPEAIATLTGALDDAEEAGTADTVTGLACRADLVDLLVCRLAAVHASHRGDFDDLVADLERHHGHLAAGTARFEPDHPVRCVTDDLTDLLWALEDGAWKGDDEAA